MIIELSEIATNSLAYPANSLSGGICVSFASVILPKLVSLIKLAHISAAVWNFCVYKSRKLLIL